MKYKRLKDITKYVNYAAYIILILFTVIIIVKSIAFGHPWSLACYVCKKCAPECILGIDPSQLLLSANLNNPNLYITATNIRITAAEACTIDTNMIVTFNGRDYKLCEGLQEKKFTKEDILFTKELRAKDAARFCIKCRACTKICPFKLPIVEIVDDLRKTQ